MKTPFFLNLLASMIVAMLSISSVSCNKDEDEKGKTDNSLYGCYTNLSDVAKQSDFNKLNDAINTHEELSSYRYDGQYHKTYVTRDIFFKNGRFDDTENNLGRLRFSISNPINAIRIIDDRTLFFYIGFLYEDGAGSGDAVYKLYAGPIFDNLTYYDDSPSYCTYIRSDDKIYVSNGDIYTAVNGALIKDGSSSRWSKYDPTKRY